MNELACINGWVVRLAAVTGRAQVYGIDWDGALVLMASGALTDCVRAVHGAPHDDLSPDRRATYIRGRIGG